jgi:beta-mannosidase
MAHAPDAVVVSLPAPLTHYAEVAALLGSRAYDAQVPGNFELDLLAAGEILDPFVGMNIVDLRRFENHHVWYSRTFTVDDALPEDGHDLFLVFEGLDCFAEVYLNGEHVASCANMLIPHEIDVTDRVRQETENELLVHLRPAAVEAARRHPYPVGVASGAQTADALYVRKALHMYGWDIFPRALSAGIWRPVRLEACPVERLEEAYLETLDAGESTARLALAWRGRFDHTNGHVYEVEVSGACGESRFTQRQRALFRAGRFVFGVPVPRRWWPRGRGPANLYDVTVRLLRDGDEIDRTAFRYGIRTVRLDRTPTTDPGGVGEFVFVVNGERVFCLGTNWVPADAYHSRDRERIPRMFALAEEVGCNMLRCWGGGVYEDDLFWDLCDEKGFLVWQDFALACAVYPQDDAFAHAIAEEAEAVIKRLRNHPSLALWCGDNECDEAYGWHHRGDPNTNRLTREVLPRALRDHDPGRPFLPSSPYIGPEAYHSPSALPMRQRLPEAHLWGPRDYYKSRYYTEAACHFVSEIGYHGSPSPESVRRFISSDKLWLPGNDEWLLHSTSPIPGVNLYDYRVELMRKQIRETFGTIPDGLDAFAFFSQCVQAEAKKFFVELFRAHKWRRTGILWWNLIDGWPQFSDAVVDYYFAPKLAFDFLKRSQQPLCLMFREPDSWQQQLVAANDTRDDLPLTYRVRDVENGETLCEGAATARADAVTVLNAVPYTASAKRLYLIEWESEQFGTSVNHYLAGNPPFDPLWYADRLRNAGLLPAPIAAFAPMERT